MSRLERVLVVDDDRDLRTALVAMLEAEGHAVVEAGHGRDALATMAETPPHLIILDLTMPVMDGRVFLEEKARSAYAGIPVVIFSSSTPGALERTPDVISVVHKLAGVEALLAAVKQAMRKPQGPPSDAFRTLQAQLLRLGVLNLAGAAACSSCLLQVPLFKTMDAGQCLRCVGRARGFAFSDSAYSD